METVHESHTPHSGDGYHEDAPLVTGNLSFHEITQLISYHTEKKPPTTWYLAFGVALTGLTILILMIAYLFWNGIGVWGNNNPAGWATATAPASVTVRAGAGVDGSDRVTLLWANGAIVNQWLQVSVLATANT